MSRRKRRFKPSPGKAWTPEALAAREEAIGRNPWGGYNHNTLGSELLRMRHYDLALSEFKRAIDINPWNADFKANLGRTYVLRGDLQNAEDAAREALVRDPHCAAAMFVLGLVCQEWKAHALAVEWYERCLASNPSVAIRRDALENLRIALSLAG